jgi:monoterpene epsilon-lactone hydrolase
MTRSQLGDVSGIPFPTSISQEALQYLSGSPAYGDDSPPADLTDTEAWLQYVKSRNNIVAEALGKAMPADLPVERSEFQIGGVTNFVIRPTSVPDDPETPIFLELHGGGLIMGGGELCRLMATGGALRRNMITWSVDYRMPPLHPYPAALDDCINLAASLLLRAKDEGLPMPAALVLITPEVDLTESGDSFHTLLGLDPILSPLMQVNLLYANGHDLSDPYLSPLFGEVTGFPPTLLQTGTRDLFLSNTVRMHRKLRAAGVEAELHVFEAMPHGGFGGMTPEDQDLAREVGLFLESHRRR